MVLHVEGLLNGNVPASLTCLSSLYSRPGERQLRENPEAGGTPEQLQAILMITWKCKVKTRYRYDCPSSQTVADLKERSVVWLKKFESFFFSLLPRKTFFLWLTKQTEVKGRHSPYCFTLCCYLINVVNNKQFFTNYTVPLKVEMFWYHYFLPDIGTDTRTCTSATLIGHIALKYLIKKICLL